MKVEELPPLARIAIADALEVVDNSRRWPEGCDMLTSRWFAERSERILGTYHTEQMRMPHLAEVIGLAVLEVVVREHEQGARPPFDPSDKEKRAVPLAASIDIERDHARAAWRARNGGQTEPRPRHPPITGRGFTPGCPCDDCIERQTERERNDRLDRVMQRATDHFSAWAQQQPREGAHPAEIQRQNFRSFAAALFEELDSVH